MATKQKRISEQQQQQRQQRERGTPKHVSLLRPKHAILLVFLVGILSAALATKLLSVYYCNSSSSSRTSDGFNNDNNIILKLAFLSLLGALCTLIGIVFGDSLTHALAFGVAILFVHCGTDIPISSAVLVASPPLLLVALTSIRGTKAVLSSLLAATSTSSSTSSILLLLHPMTIRSCCLIPFILVLHQSMMVIHPTQTNTNQQLLLRGGAAPMICFVTFITMVLMHTYYSNRAHKHGCLLTYEMKSQSIVVGITMLLSCSIAMIMEDQSSKISSSNSSSTSVVNNMIVFLLGSIISILFGYSFACVADVWYAVGSGQFLMISLDTAGMMIFFICPMVILSLRFLDMYGEGIASWFEMIRGYYMLSVPSILLSTNNGDGGDEDILPISLVILLVMVSSVIGVPLLNALCPMGGYLFSRAYTHGQPNTKRVALCVNFSELPKDDELWDELLVEKKENNSRETGRDSSKLTAVLNIYVTLEEMTLYRKELVMIAERGHFIALSPTEFDETGPSFFYGIKSTCNLQIAQYEYTELFGDQLTWLLSRSAKSSGRHPAMLCEARNLGIKVVYWSTLIQTDGRGLSIDQKNAIRDDCSDKNGGSILYLTFENGSSTSSSSSNLNHRITPNCWSLILEVISNIFYEGYSLESLSDVVRDDADMVLH